uniref:Uncharacterized protein n=1 Tax=Cynoglossus semilaevis TaxID=244447 RepID=A0A3P8X603_CYNSE
GLSSVCSGPQDDIVFSVFSHSHSDHLFRHTRSLSLPLFLSLPTSLTQSQPLSLSLSLFPSLGLIFKLLSFHLTNRKILRYLSSDSRVVPKIQEKKTEEEVVGSASTSSSPSVAPTPIYQTSSGQYSQLCANSLLAPLTNSLGGNLKLSSPRTG